MYGHVWKHIYIRVSVNREDHSMNITLHVWTGMETDLYIDTYKDTFMYGCTYIHGVRQ